MNHKLTKARIELAARIYERLEDGSLDENRFGKLLRGALAGGALAAPLATPGTPTNAVKPSRPSVEAPNDMLMQMSKRYGVPYEKLYKRTFGVEPKYNIPSLEDRRAEIEKENAQKKLNKQAVRNVLDRYYRRNQPEPTFRGDTGEGLPKGTQPEDTSNPTTARGSKIRPLKRPKNRFTRQDVFYEPLYRGFDLTRGKSGKLLGKPKQV